MDWRFLLVMFVGIIIALTIKIDGEVGIWIYHFRKKKDDYSTEIQDKVKKKKN